MLTRTRSGQEASKSHQHVGQFADSTSIFRKIDILTLKVVYTETTNPDELCEPYNNSNISIPNDVYVSNLSNTEIKNIIDDEDSFEKLDNMTKTFVQMMNYVMINESQVRGTEESRTDAFVDLVLRRLKFGEYPLMMLPRKPSKLSVYTKDISSEPDFAIVKDNCIMLVDEDKHIKNTGPPFAWGEYQIAGELIASAYCNYSASKLRYRSLLYAVRVIGLKFTFYKAEITPEYLDSLGEGFPSESVTVTRYPGSEEDKDFPHLDYTKVYDRKKIVDMLIRIREKILVL